MVLARRFPFPLLFVLLAAWMFLTLNIYNPWVGHQDANGAWISLAVRNYHWHGFFALDGMIDQNPDIVGSVSPYLHHPPLAVWLFALPTVAAGYDEAVIRFGAASCTLLSGAALYVLARRLSGRRFALWSAAFYLLTPIMMYFGRMPDHEAPALLFVLLFAAVLVNWLRRPTRRQWWALVVLAALCVWTAWGALIVIGMLGLMALFYTKRRAAIVMLGVVALAAVAALLGYYTHFYPNTGNDLREAFIWRTSSPILTSQGEIFTWGAYMLRLLLRLVTLFTPTVCALALIGAWYACRGLLTGMIAALVGAGIAYVLVFRNAAYIHDYYLLYLAPGLPRQPAPALALLPNRTPRLLRPLVVSLIIATAPAALRYLSELYAGSDDRLPQELAQMLNAKTIPGDQITTNLPTTGLAIEYYAQRRIQWNMSPAEAVARAQTFGGRVYYLYCGDARLPDDFSRLETTTINDACRLSRLR